MALYEVDYGGGGNSEFTFMAMGFRTRHGSYNYVTYFSPTFIICPERVSTNPTDPDLTSDYTFFTCSRETYSSSIKYTFTITKKCTIYLDGVKNVYDVGDTFDITSTTTEHTFTILAMG